MRLNEAVALASDRVVLRPYRRCHVTKYHAWMADEATRAATASELLSLEDEYKMQGESFAELGSVRVGVDVAESCCTQRPGDWTMIVR